MSLVQITPATHDVIIDLRYATANNVCGHKLYDSQICYLHQDAEIALKKAVVAAAHLNLRIKIFDAFRPLAVQQYMFDFFASDLTKDGFISNPQTGSIPHCRGVAIDLTLVDANGNELEMGTDFDEFSELAFHRCYKISLEAQRNRLILLGIMTLAGFDFYSKEWWHYQLFDARKYEVVKLITN